uniref:Putative secreted protein n=1 Tax=Anopheles darlingi TaxID=43151 RepID=A0A2M4DK80_ANODA
METQWGIHAMVTLYILVAEEIRLATCSCVRVCVCVKEKKRREDKYVEGAIVPQDYLIFFSVVRARVCVMCV